MGMMGGVFLIPVFAQTFSATTPRSRISFCADGVAMMIASPLGGMLTGKVESRYVIFASTLVAAIGIFLFTGLTQVGRVGDYSSSDSHGFWTRFRHGSTHQHHRLGCASKRNRYASSILALVRNISGAFGIAIFATILSNRINSNVLTINSLVNSAATFRLIFKNTSD